MIALKNASYLGRVDHLRQSSGLIASVTSYPDRLYAERPHYHERFHLSLILRGGNLEKRKQKTVERLPGTVTYYDQGEWHQSTQTLPDSQSVNLEIGDDFVDKGGIQLNPKAISLFQQPDVRFLLLQAYKELLYNDQDSLISIEAIISSILFCASKRELVSRPPLWVGKVREMLYDRWNENLGLKDLAEAAGLHPVHLSAFFTRYFGCTIGAYRRKIKIEKSLPLVMSSAGSLTEIAYFCNFADQSHFTRTFKQMTGWAPKAFRLVNAL